MLKSLHIGRYVTNPQDLRVITDFLEAIGLEQIRTENDSRSAIFSAPLGLLSINELSPQYAPEVLNRLKDVNRLIVIEVTNPDTVFEIAQRKNLRLLADTASAKTGERSFSVELPGEIVVTIHGISEEAPAGMAGNLNARGRYFAIVLARFNSFITDRLLQGALDALRRTGAAREAIDIVRVPGSFEIPAAARTLAETKRYDAIICLGCLLRGETAHYDVIVNEVTRGIGQSAQDTGVPHAFGVLTCDTLEQAIDRAGLKMGNKGFEAGLAAVEMASLKKAAGRQHSSKGKVGGAARSRNQSGKHPRKRSS